MALAAGWNSFAYAVQQLLRPPRVAMSASSLPQVLPPSSQSTLYSVDCSQMPAIPPTFQSNLQSLKPQEHVEVRAACPMLLAFVTFVIAETASSSNNGFYSSSSGGGGGNNNSSYTTHSTRCLSICIGIQSSCQLVAINSAPRPTTPGVL